jgi:hypothetical protein
MGEGDDRHCQGSAFAATIHAWSAEKRGRRRAERTDPRFCEAFEAAAILP